MDEKAGSRKLWVAIGVVVVAAAVGGGIVLSGPSAEEREIAALIAENRDMALAKLKQILVADEQSKEASEDWSRRSRENGSGDEPEEELARRIAELSPRPNFDIASPEGNAVVIPGAAVAEVRLALSGKYDRRYGMWYGPGGQIGEAVPKSAMCVGIVPRPVHLDVSPWRLKQWFEILPKVRYILDYTEESSSATATSSDQFSGGYSRVETRLFDVETGRWLGGYRVSSSSSSSVEATIVKGQDVDNYGRVENALANDLSAGTSGSFLSAFYRFFPWEKK